MSVLFIASLLLLAVLPDLRRALWDRGFWSARREALKALERVL